MFFFFDTVAVSCPQLNFFCTATNIKTASQTSLKSALFLYSTAKKEQHTDCHICNEPFSPFYFFLIAKKKSKAAFQALFSSSSICHISSLVAEPLNHRHPHLSHQVTGCQKVPEKFPFHLFRLPHRYQAMNKRTTQLIIHVHFCQ